MEKKLSPGKVVGIIFCILAGICTVILLFIDGYFSGQMKTIDKYFTSITRGDLNGYKSCFPAETAAAITETKFEADAEVCKYQFGIDIEEVKTSVTFVGRGEKWLDSTTYTVVFEVTFYNDNDHTTKKASVNLLREGMKWVIGS